jgi:ubiquinone/menaquinone biosynthesis C-methylase UbiE
VISIGQPREAKVSRMSFRERLKVPRKMWYEFFASLQGQGNMYFMNYGYNYADALSRPEMLDAIEERHRLQNQLYHHVLGEISLENCNVLEVGCGGGAGSLYLTRHFNPRSFTGVDLATHAIRCCSLGHSYPNLRYLVADAEKLPFSDGSFDVVINVESSHGYASMTEFVNNVYRVLIPGGYFLFADFRGIHEFVPLDHHLRASGLHVIAKKFISSNVLEALKYQEEQKQIFLLGIEQPEIRAALREFIGGRGSFIYEGLKSGKMTYLSYVLQKPLQN